MPNVLIISNSLDVHSETVEAKLRESGVRVIRLNTDRFSSDRIELVLRPSDDEEGILVNGTWCSLAEIASVWYRRPGNVEVGIEDPRQKQFAEAEIGELLRQLYYNLDHALWVSRYDALERARRKLPQLEMARNVGMRIPRTIVTNAPDKVRAFLTECGERIIYKTLHAPVIKPGDGPELWGVPTTLLTHQYLEHLDLIRGTGGIFQEYIDKAYEVRVTVIGSEVFAAKIDSQADDAAKIDWRDAVAYEIVKVTPYDLPSKVAEQCRTIVAAYKLNFGAIDLIRTPDGEYVFLEINCNGQWLWIEDLTGQRLVDSMVRLLTLKQSLMT